MPNPCSVVRYNKTVIAFNAELSKIVGPIGPSDKN